MQKTVLLIWMLGRAFLPAQRSTGHRSGVSAGSDQLRLKLVSVCPKDSLRWMMFRMRNESSAPFRVDRVQFIIEDIDEKCAETKSTTMYAWYSDLPRILPGRSGQRFVFAFKPFHLGRTQRMVIQLDGMDGREVILKLGSKVFRE